MNESINVERIRAMKLVASHAAGGWFRGEETGVASVFTGAGTPTANGVMCARDAASPDSIALLAGAFADAPAPWGIQVETVPQMGIEAVAASVGLKDAIHVPTMCLDLQGYVSGEQSGAVAVERATADHADEFAQVMAAGFEMSAVSLAAPFANPEFFASPGVSAFWAKTAEGEPVAVGVTVATSRATVGLYAIATRPEYRRRGHGIALTGAMLESAAAEGAYTAYLQATDEGQAVYTRLGFVVAENLTYFV